MRSWKTGLLLASVAMAAPGHAQDHQHWQGGGAPHGDRGPQGGERPAPPQGGAPGAGAPRGFQPGPQGQPGQPPHVHFGGGDRPGPGGGFDRGPQGRPGNPGAAPRGYAGGPEARHVEVRPQGDVNVWRDRDRGGPRRDPRFDGRPGGGDPRFAGRPGGPGWGGGPGNPRGQGYRPDNRDWNRGWRDDRRYDWQGWRDGHRSAYRLGRYYAPPGFGYGYRRFGIGAALPSAFFAESYWIGDPAYYRLPPAYGPYRWVRYYNDALLIDLRTGGVVDSIPDFFW